MIIFSRITKNISNMYICLKTLIEKLKKSIANMTYIIIRVGINRLYGKL